MNDVFVPSVIEGYTLEKQIGVGTTSVVWLSTHIKTNMQVAIKIIPKVRINDTRCIARFSREVNLLKSMDHPLIAQLFQIFEDENNHYFVLEFAEGGNLVSMIAENGNLVESVAKQIFIQLISVLEYMHSVKNVAHRDIKAENILLDKHRHLRLIDFGFSRSFTWEDPTLITACGSPGYIPPEMIKKQGYTVSADIWSAGVLLYTMVVGHLPFEGDTVIQILQKIAYNEPNIPRFLSPNIQDLLKRMLCKDPLQRITIRGIKEHPWFSEPIYNELLEMIPSSLTVREDEDRFPYEFDEEIGTELHNLGIDTSNIEFNLNNRLYDETTASYLILFKNKLSKEMAPLFSLPPSMRDKDEKRQSPIPITNIEHHPTSPKQTRNRSNTLEGNFSTSTELKQTSSRKPSPTHSPPLIAPKIPKRVSSSYVTSGFE